MVEYSAARARGDTLGVAVPRRSVVAAEFTLRGLAPTVVTETLFGLQQRDNDRLMLAPSTVRRAMAVLPTGLGSLLELDEAFLAAQEAVLAGLLRSIQRHLRRVQLTYTGLDSTDGDVWDSALLGLRSGRGTGRHYTAVSGTVDFRPIRQRWLRELVKEYGRSVRPSVSELRVIVASAAIASGALAQRPHGEHPERLAMADMSAVAEAFRNARKADGTHLSFQHRNALFRRWRVTLDFCRQAGLMDDIPGGFAVNTDYHRMVQPAPAEDAISRTIPEHLIRQLDASQALLVNRSTFSNGGWAAGDFGEMYCLVYVLLRDTGRRPGEIVSLRRDCVEWVDGKPTLVWDNHKRGRPGRRLPIHRDTADAIATWVDKLAKLPRLSGCEQWLFPAPGARNRPRRGHMSAQTMCSRVFPEWLASIPQLLDVGLDEHGQPVPYDRSTVTPYGFRHAYAQRHADNGTPVDVLRELMDHRSVETTMIYYQVSLKRKREAINQIAEWTIDRHGNPRGFTDALAYQRESVSVPFGNCTEPSNVKAGGQQCPIRFQCAGCSFYRPDPSYLPAVEEHIARLRADKETAMAADAAGWVIDNLDQQIGAFGGVVTALRRRIDGAHLNLPRPAH